MATLIRRNLIAAATLTLIGSPTLACYSGLALIPTADMIGDRQYSAELQLDGSVSGPTSETRVINTQFGFGDRLEAGLDFDVSDDTNTQVFVNAKYLLGTDTSRGLSFAAGVFSMEPSVKSSPYLVATKELGALRLHIGGLRSESSNYWFTGVDRVVSSRLTLMGDYTNGNGNYSSLGFNYQLDERVGLMLGAQFPNGSGGTLYTMHCVICGKTHRW
ncbi:MAG: hypothetical protein ACYC64_10720 [Armatimonadota bacterium]